VTRYVYGIGLIGEETGGNFITYHFDHRGSAKALTDMDGNVIQTFSYGPNGELVNGNPAAASTPFLYGGLYGVATDANGLCYMRARYYLPAISRFINQDTTLGSVAVGVSMNRFAYANGDPIDNNDPFGLAAQPLEDNAKEAKEPSESEKIGTEVFDATGSPGWGALCGGLTAADGFGTYAGDTTLPLHFISEGFNKTVLDPVGYGKIACETYADYTTKGTAEAGVTATAGVAGKLVEGAGVAACYESAPALCLSGGLYGGAVTGPFAEIGAPVGCVVAVGGCGLVALGAGKVTEAAVKTGGTAAVHWYDSFMESASAAYGQFEQSFQNWVMGQGGIPEQ
jgi:RHS repeat-associated protein